MSIIQSQFNLVHFESQLNASGAVQRTAVESGFSAASISVGSTEETVDYGDIRIPRQVALKFLSGDRLQVGLATGVYPLELTDENEWQVLRLAGRPEIMTVTTVSDVADSLQGTYFTITDSNGYVWSIGIGAFAGPGLYDLSATISTGASAADVAAALVAAMEGSAEFLEQFSLTYDAATDDDFITITNRYSGNRTDIADTGSTGFTLATTQQGEATPSVFLKSAGTSQVVVAVIPN